MALIRDDHGAVQTFHRIDPRALVKMNLKKSLDAIRVGVSSPEHRAFCGKLKAVKRSK